MKAIFARALLVVTALLVVCSTSACSVPPDPGREAPQSTPFPAKETQVSASGPQDQRKPTEPADSPGQSIQPATPSASGADGTGSPADPLAASLQGLELDDFFEASWRELSLRDPETILADGLAGVYGLQGAELTDISDAYLRDTQQMRATVLELLKSYDRDQLQPEQQISYDIYEWYLEDKAREDQFRYYGYPATFFPVTAVHELTTHFFSDLHPIASKSDAEDYVTRLGQVGVKFEQLLEGLRLREEAGIVPPAFASQWALYGVRGVAGSSPTQTPYYQALATKIDTLKDLAAADKQELLDSAEQAIGDSVLPAFHDLAAYLEHLASVAPGEDGLWQFPDGDAYYAHLLRHYTTTSLTASEIHELGLQELERIHAEMRDRFDALGYPDDESLPALFDRVAQDGGQIPASEVIDAYISFIDHADQNLDAAFDLRPQAGLQVITSPIKGMYVASALDGSRPGAFHAGPGNTAEERYAMPTLAYHEAIPGHHFQISLAQEAALPSFRRALSFDGYAEGWALYSEQLASELGWYEDDPYGDLGRLQAEAFRAARLVVDTGIHAQGWTFDQALEFFVENTGYEPGDSVEPSLQIARYIVWPGQSTSYKIGMLKILELRQRAMDDLGDRFDLKSFHNVVLRNGSMPLEILDQVVDGHIEAEMSRVEPPEPSATSLPQNAHAGPPDEQSGLTATIVYDNRTYSPGLKARWGFAALLEVGDHTLLFDTGGDSPALLSNLDKLGFDPREIEAVVLSHIHLDHTGGLKGLLDTGVRPTIYVPASFPASLKDEIRARTELVEVTAPIEIFPGVHSTGEINASIHEQGLAVETAEGTVVITGCAHPGIVRMVRAARTIVDGEIALVMGGFHLGDATKSQIVDIIADFRDLGVQRVSPTHCTGNRATSMFSGEYGDGYIQGGVGRTYILGSRTPEQANAPETIWPTDRWATSTPEEQGMDSELLAEMLDTIEQEAYDIDSVAIVRHGHLVADAAIQPFEPDAKHIIHSCTKSIVSALIGIAIADGHIEGVDQPVLDLLPGRIVTNLDARKGAMTLQHLLTMTTGLDCQDSYLYRWRGLEEMRGSDDWVQHMLDLPMVDEPGARFEYCNGASFLLSAIIQGTTGMSALEYAQENLFGPLGISDVDWPASPQGISIGWGELWMVPHDLAKFGYLYLHGGQWAGKHLVSSSWVDESTGMHIPATLQGGYGYQWWIDDSGSYYMALGYAGQFVFVLPQLDMVVVFASDLADREFYIPQDLLVEYILPSVLSSMPLEPNPGGVALLQARLQDLATP